MDADAWVGYAAGGLRPATERASRWARQRPPRRLPIFGRAASTASSVLDDCWMVDLGRANAILEGYSGRRNIKFGQIGILCEMPALLSCDWRCAN